MTPNNDDPKSRWKPIETAPHDGSVIEMLGSNGKLDNGYWCAYGDGSGEWSTCHGEAPYTHWREFDDGQTGCVKCSWADGYVHTYCRDCYAKTCPNPDRIYPCAKCGVMRTKAEGGTAFTLCENCDAAQTRETHNCDAMGCSSVRHYYTADVAQQEEQLACTKIDQNILVLSTGKTILLTPDETQEVFAILNKLASGR